MLHLLRDLMETSFMDRQLTRKQWGLLFYDTPKCVCVCDCSVSVLQIEQNNMNSCWECLNVEQPWKNRTTSSDWLVSPQYSLVKEQITASKNFVNFDEPSWHPAHHSGLANTYVCVLNFLSCQTGRLCFKLLCVAFMYSMVYFSS